MNQPVRWVTKEEAAEELEISLSTLDRMIRKGEIEVSREGRRVYVRMHGPEYLSDEELLRRAIIREDELERTVRQLERSASELKNRASELERERDEAREAVSAGRQAYEENGGGVPQGAGSPREDEGIGHQARPGRCRAARGRRSGHVATVHLRID